jgi:hypothetical protein
VNPVNAFSGAVSAWGSFFVIVGSSGGALIGLQFVVLTLVAGRSNPTAGSLSAFGTPTVVQLAGALVLSAIMSAPWPSLVSLSIVIGMCGLGGLTYGAIVIGLARSQTFYQPVWQDWLWYTLLPCSVYAALAVASLLLRANIQIALFVIAAAALGLLLIGIHNAWDTVTHLVTSGSRGDETKTN